MPGLGGSGALFRWLIEALGEAADTRVIVYADGERLVDFVQSASQQLPVDRPVYLVAESFSGPVAIKLLANAEFDFVGATLCNTFATPPYPALLPLINIVPTAMLGVSRLSSPILRWWVGNGQTHRGPSAARKWNSIMASVNSQDRRRLHGQLRALRDFDVEQLLPSIDIPVLYLQGSADRLIRRAHGRRIANGLRQVRVETVDGPHMLLQLAAPECARLINRQIEGVSFAPTDHRYGATGTGSKSAR